MTIWRAGMMVASDPMGERRGERWRRAGRPLLLATLVLCLLASLSPTPGFAAEVITDGDMEIAPLTNWTASTGTTAGTRSKATDQFNTTASSLKFETDKLQATAVEWWESQSVGIVNATDTVVLNLWWGAQWAIAAGTAGTVYFDVKPASGSWTTAWSQVLTPSTSFQSGTAVNQTISDSFTTTDTYEVRLRFAGNTGDNKNARMNVWWDTVSLDVTGPACVHAQPTVTMVTGDQTVCPGGTANYTFTATNNCSAGCSDESFNLSYGDDTGNFTSSGPGSTGLLTPGATSGNLTLTVDLTAAATGTNTSTITAALASHTDGTNSDAQTTADTTPPGDPSFSSCTGVSTSEIDLVFTDPGTSAGGGVVVVRGMPAGTAPDWAPTDGQAPPTEGTTDPGTGDVFVFVGTGTSDSDISLAANQSYSYEVWAYDGCNNYTTTEVPTTCSTQAAGNNAPTISSTQADDTVTSGTNITTCAGRDVTITATADDLDSDPLDWTVHTGQSPSFSTCTSETVQTPPDPMSCIISSIATTTDYYMEATDGTDTTTDPSGAPGTYYTITVDSTGEFSSSFSSCNGSSTSQIDLGFGDPGTGVLVVRGPAGGTCPTFAPSDGASYGTGTQGSDEIVFSGVGTSHSDSPLAENTSYCYEVWAYDDCYNYQTTADSTTCSTQSGGQTCTDEANDGDMEAAGTTNWSTTGVTNFGSAAKAAGEGNLGTQALKGQSVSTPGVKKITVAWNHVNTPSLGTVNTGNGDTVSLSLWYAHQITLNAGGAAVNLYVDVRELPAGSWTQAWTVSPTPSTSKTTGSVSSQDITGAFGGSADYEFRLRFEGITGNNNDSQAVIWWDDVVLEVCSTPSANLTVGDGAGEPGNDSRCPDGAAVAMDTFTLSADSSVTATAIQVTLDAPADSWQGVSSVQIRTGGGALIDEATPSSNTVNVTGLNIPVGVSPTTYGVWIVPQTHGGMPVPPGSTYSISGTVSDVTAPASVTDNDNTSSTIIVDNASPADPTDFDGTAADSEVVLSWTNQGTQGVDWEEVVVLRRAGGAVSVSPDEGTDYSAQVGNDIGSGNFVAYVGTGSGHTDGSLSNGTQYYYEIFAKDPCGNYSIGAVGASQPYQPASTKGVTEVATTAVASSCKQITVTAEFSGDVGTGNTPNTTTVEYSDTGAFAGEESTACGTLTGSSPRQCLVTQLTPDSNYWVKVSYTDPDGVTYLVPPNPPEIGPIAVPACPVSGDDAPPTVLFLAPSKAAIIGGSEQCKVQVYDASGPVASVEYSVDGGGYTAASLSTNYNCNIDDCTDCCGVYEFTVDTTAMANGPHYFTVKAIDGDSNSAEVTQAVEIQNVAAEPAGDGFLLRRTHGSGLCTDCHNIATHSSQGGSSKYGSWALECMTCHTPHYTRNIHLVREVITTPNSGDATVVFQNSTPGSNLGYLGDRSGADNAPYNDGVCEVCHTRTSKHQNVATGDPAGVHGHEADNSTSGCTDCHSHGSGFGAPACDGCHNAPPTVGKHGSHDEVGALPTAYDNKNSSATTTQYGFACAKCHSGDHINDSNDPYQVEVVFDNTVAPTNPDGGYTPGAARPDDTGNNGTFAWTDGSCTNLYCHSIAQRSMTPDTADYKTVTWDQAAALNCISCHAEGGGASTLSAAHSTHTDAATYRFGCIRCHAATLDTGSVAVDKITGLTSGDFGNKALHVNGVRTVDFDGSGPDNSGGNYTDSPGFTCDNTYCHSTGQDRTAPYGSGASIAWTATAAADCTSCHGKGGNGSALSLAHTEHTDSASPTATAYGCVTCHAVTVQNATTGDINPTTIDNYGTHVNATADVDFHASVTGGAGLGFTPGTEGQGTCSEVDCHSSGQASPTYRTPAWNNAPSNVCMYCHGSEGSGVAGEPRYPNGGVELNNSNSHPKHVGQASDCAKCHNDTTTTGTSITTPANHLDGNRQVVFGAGVSGTYTPADKSCSVAACHGPGTPKWGGPSLLCLDCHGHATDDTDDWQIPGGGTAAVAVDEWRHSGHGRTVADQSDGHPSGNYDVTGNPAANFHVGGANPCLYCHDGDVGHGSANNPFRLLFTPAVPSDPQPEELAQVCLNCHGDGSSGVQPSGYTSINGTVKINSYHFGQNHPLGTDSANGGQFCWDCHDPHGDRDSGGGNIFMVGRQVTRVSTGQHGIPDTTITGPPAGLVDPVFTNNVALSDYGKPSSPFDGICNVCHTYGDNYTWNSAEAGPHGSSAPPGDVCTTACHDHNTGPPSGAFGTAGGPLNCLEAGCHDRTQSGWRDLDGDEVDDYNYTRRDITPDFSKNSHHVGTGSTNMGGALTAFDCIVCHAEGEDDGVAADPVGTSEHGNKLLEFWDTDTAFGSFFLYDVDRIANSAGAAANWNSANQRWREWTSGVDEVGGDTLPTLPEKAGLDPFCLSCHDDDGATGTYNVRDVECDPTWETNRPWFNPFCDASITNEVDFRPRNEPPPTGPEKVIDVASQVVDGGTDLDGDGTTDPPQGKFARHPIRGKSTSRYSVYNQAIAFGQTIYNYGGFTNLGSDEFANPVWNDTSVMGCADCHTTDGANKTAGNAHGSNSEYLLKDAAGGATEGTKGDDTYVCYRCHEVTKHKPGVGHTANKSDYVDTTHLDGDARKGSQGVLFGIACLNCHGAPDWGTIHATSQEFERPDLSVRQAYRFMNGGSQRYYVDNGWEVMTTGEVTCWTLAAEDEWGSCTQHDGGYQWGDESRGKAGKPLKRSLTY